jgi:hypothetical protein
LSLVSPDYANESDDNNDPGDGQDQKDSYGSLVFGLLEALAELLEEESAKSECAE